MSQTPTPYQPYTPGRPGPEEAPHQQRYGGAPDCLVVASVVCVVIWATSGFGYFWPVWVLLPTFLPVVLRWRGPEKLKAAAGVSGHLRRRLRN